MTRRATNILATRIAKLVEQPAARRIIFRLNPSEGAINVPHALENFKQTVKRIYGQQAYKLVWFRCADGSAVVAIAGSRPVVAHAKLFLLAGVQKEFFSAGEVVYEGIGHLTFQTALDQLLWSYSPTLVKHSFGGSSQ
ncbi:hypothetical protein [Pseudomonas sp. 44 R 15]|uniref:hypothetical protein n=1 Tax=Pseudomonas sp. 44 R 15 TaxID=1844105 RepID=UPI00081C083B|nr:hypothetical protein [Pseudomonas sp. 44 R 15]